MFGSREVPPDSIDVGSALLRHWLITPPALLFQQPLLVPGVRADKVLSSTTAFWIAVSIFEIATSIFELEAASAGPMNLFSA